jgi:hypothetical protein
VGVEGLVLVNWRLEAHFSTCPSRRSRVLIWDRKSGSCVVGVYAVATFGTRTGVTGCD